MVLQTAGRKIRLGEYSQDREGRRCVIEGLHRSPTLADQASRACRRIIWLAVISTSRTAAERGLMRWSNLRRSVAALAKPYSWEQSQTQIATFSGETTRLLLGLDSHSRTPLLHQVVDGILFPTERRDGVPILHGDGRKKRRALTGRESARVW